MKKEIISEAFYNTAIPNDWEIVKVANFGKVYTGNTPPTEDVTNYGTDYLFVSPGDLSEEKYVTRTEKGLSKKGFTVSRKFPKGSVLFTCIGSTIGKSGIASEELTSNQQINAIVVNDKNSNEFLYYQLERNSNKIKLLAGEQAVPIINKSQFESVKILRAPLPEQKAIAHILGLMDTAINQNNQLIAQKELHKKWLMQNLLTGKKRLKGFSGEWELFQLDKVADVRDGTHESPEYFRDGIKFITSKNIKDGELDFSNISYISEEDAINFNKRSKVDKGDILMSMIGTIGNCVLIDFEPDFCVKNVGLIKPKKINANYLIQYFYSTLFQNYLLGKLDGGIQKFISLSGLRELKISVPTIKEQTAIAQLLQAADKEIQLLKTKTEKLRLQKKGMMQVLLTGKKRLKI